MQPKKVLSDLEFVGEVVSMRQTYYVYEGPEHYVLMSVNKAKGTYNLNVVSKEASQYVRGLFAGKSRITSTDVMEKSRKPSLIKGRFDALSALYALCALGAAKIDARSKSKSGALFFNVHKLK